MNRIQALPQLADPVWDNPVSGSLDTAEARCGSLGQDRASTIFHPLHYEPGYAYPLLVWLHGPGTDEHQLRRIMPLVSMRNYAAVSVRGTVESPWPARGYTWSQGSAHVAIAEQRVFDAIGAARERLSIAPRRIFLAGFDVGGTMAFRLAMSHPQSFAGVLSIGGRFPTGRNPLVWLNDARRVPVLLACGRDSRSYRPEDACSDLKLFHAAGMHVDLRQYPCGQELSPLMLADMDRWMMDYVTSRPANVD